MTDAPEMVYPAVEVREECAQTTTPVRALTHDQQIAEYVRLVEEARMRT